MADHGIGVERRAAEILADLAHMENVDIDAKLSVGAARRAVQDMLGCARAEVREARGEAYNAGIQLGAQIVERAAREAFEAAREAFDLRMQGS